MKDALRRRAWSASDKRWLFATSQARWRDRLAIPLFRAAYKMPLHGHSAIRLVCQRLYPASFGLLCDPFDRGLAGKAFDPVNLAARPSRLYSPTSRRGGLGEGLRRLMSVVLAHSGANLGLSTEGSIAGTKLVRLPKEPGQSRARLTKYGYFDCFW